MHYKMLRFIGNKIFNKEEYNTIDEEISNKITIRTANTMRKIWEICNAK